MNSNLSFAVKKYQFEPSLTNLICESEFVRNFWPVVYIISDGSKKLAYVGETADASTRLKTHLKNEDKNKLTEMHLIESDKFNKSATLDIESNLIKYLSGDGKFQLLNGNLGLVDHNYYQKSDVYWDMFQSIWGQLRAEGITRHSLEYIDNSDLFKYSPYKSLSLEQRKGLSMIVDNLLNDSVKNLVIKGGAGTGKTILAVFLFKLLASDISDFNLDDLGGKDNLELIGKIKQLRMKYGRPKMALVVPMTSFRNTLKKVFSNVNGLKASMVLGPSEITKERYDIILVDEAHRLRRRVNLTNYKSFDDVNKRLGLGKNGKELDWIGLQSNCAIYFYDPNQSVKPSDVQKEDFKRLIDNESTQVEYLISQFRVRGGNGYVRFMENLLSVNVDKLDSFDHPKYDLKLFNSLSEMVESIKEKNQEEGLSRLIAGYSWEWVSKTNPEKFDIEIEEVKLRWNKTNADWINSEGSVEEVGCIHTTQGYDLNYAGVIFGREIGYDKTNKEIRIKRDKYYDKNGRNGVKSERELEEYIINIYKTILLRGIKGTYIYICDPDLREYFASYIGGHGAVQNEHKFLKRELIPWENSVPLYDLDAAAGDFSDLQFVDEAHVEWVLLEGNNRISKDLFACRVQGESMNKIISNGAICLFRKYNGGSRNGKIVLAQSNDIHDSEMGSGYTVKEYISKKVISDTGWGHESITLKPLSYDSSYQPIELSQEGLESFKTIGIFERVLEY